MDENSRDPLDIEVGARIAARRVKLNIRRDELAHSLSLTEQQVARYERGAARIPVSSLIRIAAALKTPAQTLIGDQTLRREDSDDELVEALLSPGAGDLLRAFARIQNEQARRAVIALVGHLGDSRPS